MSSEFDGIDRAERKFLGALLRDSRLFGEIGKLSKDDFRGHAHGLIFEAAARLNAAGRPAFADNVAEALHRNGQAGEIGDFGYFIDLCQSDNLTAGDEALWAEHLRTIRRHSTHRKVRQAFIEAERDAADPSLDPLEVMSLIDRRIQEIASGIATANDALPVAETVREALEAIDERRSRSGNRYGGIPSGYASLDDLTTGLKDGELVIIAARPSAGKTAIACNLVRHVVVDEGLPVLFVSMEQSRIELTERFLCVQGRVDGGRLQSGRLRPAERERLLEASEVLSRSPLLIDDSQGQSLMRITTNARREKGRRGIRMLVIDYLQLIEPENRREPREQQVATMSRRLKLLARELRIPVVVLAQLNREAEKRDGGRPKLSDLRESGAIEQDADKVILLHRHVDERGYSEGLIDTIVAKHRNGRTGTASLLFVKSQMRFESIESDARRKD